MHLVTTLNANYNKVVSQVVFESIGGLLTQSTIPSSHSHTAIRTPTNIGTVPASLFTNSLRRISRMTVNDLNYVSKIGNIIVINFYFLCLNFLIHLIHCWCDENVTKKLKLSLNQYGDMSSLTDMIRTRSVVTFILFKIRENILDSWIVPVGFFLFIPFMRFSIQSWSICVSKTIKLKIQNSTTTAFSFSHT